jgi:uncharacterized membrane protein
MFTVERSISINRPRQEVYDFTADPSNLPKWQSQILSAEWSSEGPHGVGSTCRSVALFMGREMEITSQITMMDPPNQQAFKTVGGPVPTEGGFKFDQDGNGTKITMFGRLDPGGFLKLVEGMAKKQIENQFVTNLEALKHLLESGSA